MSTSASVPHRSPSTVAWIVAHLLYPLLPAILEAILRFVALSWKIDLNTLNAATLAMSVALIAVFVNQSIRSSEVNKAGLDDASINGVCTFFTMMAIAFFVLFGVLVLLNALVADAEMKGLKVVLEAFQTITMCVSVVPLVAAIAAQRTYKLRASLV